MKHDLILREIQMRKKMPEGRQTQKTSLKLRKINPRSWPKNWDKSKKYLPYNPKRKPRAFIVSKGGFGGRLFRGGVYSEQTTGTKSLFQIKFLIKTESNKTTQTI